MNEQPTFTYIHYPWDSRTEGLEHAMRVARLDFCFLTQDKPKSERVYSAIAFLQNYINWDFALCDTEIIAAILVIHKFSLVDGKSSNLLSLICNAWHYVHERDVRQYSILKDYNKEKLIEEIMAKYLYMVESLFGTVSKTHRLRAALALVIMLRLQHANKSDILALYLISRW